MNAYLIIILASLVLSWLLGIISGLLDSRNMSPEIPAEFRDMVDAESYAKSQAYTRASKRFAAVANTANTALTLVVILMGGFNWLDIFVCSLDLSPVVTGVVYMASLGAVSSLFGLPFEIYDTFVLEERFGFNTTTIKTFIADRIKGIILTGVLGSGLIAGVLYFFETAGGTAWLWCWGLASLFSLVLTYIAPTWILPLFNRFSPLEEGPLREAIMEYARSVGFRPAGIFVMDGSKRSTKSNAFFTGFGKRKRIALYDTLINEQSVDEIVSVLAHEVGHSKLGHIRRRFIVSVFKTGAVFFLMSLFMHSPGLFEAFGMEHMSTYAGLVFFILLYTPVSLVLTVVSGVVSRRHEFEADAYAARTTGKPEVMIGALKKLSASNLVNLTPHPLTVALEYSHPPVLQRIQRLNVMRKKWSRQEAVHGMVAG